MTSSRAIFVRTIPHTEAMKHMLNAKLHVENGGVPKSVGSVFTLKPSGKGKRFYWILSWVMN